MDFRKTHMRAFNMDGNCFLCFPCKNMYHSSSNPELLKKKLVWVLRMDLLHPTVNLKKEFIFDLCICALMTQLVVINIEWWIYSKQCVQAIVFSILFSSKSVEFFVVKLRNKVFLFRLEKLLSTKKGKRNRVDYKSLTWGWKNIIG